MTSESMSGSPMEDPWADAVATDERGPAALLHLLPGGLDDATEAMAGAMRAMRSSVEHAPDDGLIVGASIASGVALGLLIGGGPRLLTAGAVLTAVSLGASLVQRHPRRFSTRARALSQS